MTQIRTFAIPHRTFFPKAPDQEVRHRKREKTQSQESHQRLAHPLKYHRRKTRHGDVRPSFSIGQKSETDGIPISLTPTPKNSPSCPKGRPEKKQQVNPANGDLLHARLALKEKRANQIKKTLKSPQKTQKILKALIKVSNN
ncbi:hypothetical protein AVEN_174012-1 [Araneus ventricosus]|uniref:Uncharacterized protein n=1 Tax=Araneus ventricosus TaxID=182803 RepID=A0A4Y2LLQ5_ARAVE|nr:hypothetical protein AVEN_174012-1 [Araneus ventricosus]